MINVMQSDIWIWFMLFIEPIKITNVKKQILLHFNDTKKSICCNKDKKIYMYNVYIYVYIAIVFVFCYNN